MDANGLKFFSAELGAKILTLDLHGQYPSDAKEKVEIFLYDCHQKSEEICRIIYGGGTGKLRDVVLSQVKVHPLAKDFKDEGGSCVVLI